MIVLNRDRTIAKVFNRKKQNKKIYTLNESNCYKSNKNHVCPQILHRKFFHRHYWPIKLGRRQAQDEVR